MAYNIGVVTAPDFATIQEDADKASEYVDSLMLRISGLRQDFGTVKIHITSARKLDHAIASGCYHSNLLYSVYHPFVIKPTFYQTNTEYNYKNMQYYASGACEQFLVFNSPFHPKNIIELWKDKFQELDKIFYVGDPVYLNKLRNSFRHHDIEVIA